MSDAWKALLATFFILFPCGWFILWVVGQLAVGITGFLWDNFIVALGVNCIVSACVGLSQAKP